MLKISCAEVTAKILLDSLTSILRKIAKNKHSAILYAEHDKPNILQVRELAGRAVENQIVESTEHRARVFYILSTHEFRQKSQDYIQFRIPIIEFNRIITQQSILSGNSGGLAEILVCPIPDEPNMPPNRCSIKFSVKNHSGAAGGVTIFTRLADDNSVSVPIQHVPLHEIRMKYFLTYLKRSQNLFAIPSDLLTVFISERGLLIQTDAKEHHSVVIYTCDVSNEDIDSFA